jgi:NAD(P)-dependent dehydrogenase (short-subunit alcohol dehydrogenase family)
MDLNLDGEVAVVTGAGKGIGLAVTSAPADEGAQVIAGSRIRGPRVSVPGPFETQMGWLSDYGSGALSFKNGIDIPFFWGDC